jgi:hypothetical protein
MIVPLPLLQSEPKPPIRSTTCSKFRSWCAWTSKVKSTWYAVQLSHRGGKYSIERMLALEEYTREKSLLRVLLVCLGTPLPMIVLVILQEYVPLQEPKAGWSANYGFWVRVGILGGFVAIGMVAQAERLTEGVAFSWRQYLLIFCSQAVSYPAASMLVAHLWAFPIPFMGISLNVIFVLLFVGGFRAIGGKGVIRKMLSNKERLVRHVSFVSAQLVLSIVYPVYQVVFNLALDSHFEIPVILLLPLLKLVMKNILLRTITHVEDMMPEGIIFTVDFFNALYLVSSMQSASSIVTVLALMIVDFTQTVVQLRGLYQRTSTILRRLHQAVGDSINSGGVLPTAVLLCSTKFDQQTRASIQVRSCLPHQLSASSRRLLDTLEGQPKSPSVSDLPHKKLRATKSLDWNFVRRVTAAVHPDRMATLVLGVKHYNDDAVRAAAIARLARSLPALHTEILHETLEMLFTSECIVLTEYLESVIPLVYASFVLIMVHLPSARYHTELDGVTTENVGSTVSSIFVYALLELESFVVLAGMLRRNCGMRALYHLAFVLETQAMLIQTKLVVWVLMTLAFRVVHFGKSGTGPIILPLHQILTSCCCLSAGVDFTFQFAWVP